jgi:DHA1 family tetracycline resistance protein-like MFS transporter
MPATLSKDESAAEKKKQSQIGSLCTHGFLNVTVLCVTIQAEIQLIRALFKGDVAKSAQFLSMTAGMAGLTEFLLNPTVGKLSDAYGRRNFLLIGCAWATIGNFLVFLQPKNLFLVGLNRFLCWGLLTVSGSVTGSAAMSDLSSGQELGINLGRYFSAFGLGVIVGPAIGGFVLSRTGDPRYAYLARSMVALFELIHDYCLLQETLPVEERIEPSLVKYQNPFGFIRLFSENATLVKLVGVAFLICWSEGKNTNDVFQLWLQEDVALPVNQANLVTIAYGVMMFSSGKYICPYLINNIGARNFTSLTLCSSAAAFGLWGSFPKPWALMLGMLLYYPGINATSANAMRAMGTDHAVAAGYGRGEFAGLFNNLRAVTVAAASPIYGNLYAFCAQVPRVSMRKGSHASIRYKRHCTHTRTRLQPHNAFKSPLPLSILSPLSSPLRLLSPLSPPPPPRSQNGHPVGYVWYLIMFIAAIAPELLHRSITDKELEDGLKKKE